MTERLEKAKKSGCKVDKTAVFGTKFPISAGFASLYSARSNRDRSAFFTRTVTRQEADLD